ARDHGILCTLHAERGIDAVPVVYVLDVDGYVGVPGDRVKPKASVHLQRERNLAADPRATLLVEHWDRRTGRGCGGCAPSCAGRATPPPTELRPWPPHWPVATLSIATSPSPGCSCCASSAYPAGRPTPQVAVSSSARKGSRTRTGATQSDDAF